MKSITRHVLFPAFLSLIPVAAMTVLAEIFSQPEIIFPEIAALVVGAIAAPRQSWNVSRTRMAILMAICSVLGIIITNFSPFIKPVNFCIAFALCQGIYLFSRTGFAPLISAAVLPVLMGTNSIIYPVSAISLTLLVIAMQEICFKCKFRHKRQYIPGEKMQKQDIILAVFRIIAVSSISIPAIVMGLPFCVAPPLLVAFTEFSRVNSPLRKSPVRVVLLISACALFGAISRIVLCEDWGLPLTIAAVVAVGICLTLMAALNIYFPPAAALAILPMIADAGVLWDYPAEIFMGAIIFMGFSFVPPEFCRVLDNIKARKRSHNKQ